MKRLQCPASFVEITNPWHPIEVEDHDGNAVDLESKTLAVMARANGTTLRVWVRISDGPVLPVVESLAEAYRVLEAIDGAHRLAVLSGQPGLGEGLARQIREVLGK